MKKIKSESGSITMFVILAFIFCMAMLVSMYWTSTNNHIAVLQAEQRIKEIYGKDVNNVEQIYQEIESRESAATIDSAESKVNIEMSNELNIDENNETINETNSIVNNNGENELSNGLNENLLGE